MSTEQLQNAQNKKAELLIILGHGLSSWHRAGVIKDPNVKAICNEIAKLDAIIGGLKNLSIDVEAGLCPQCRQPLTPDVDVCPGCGFEMLSPFSANVKPCGTCKGMIIADSNWCPICGAKAAEDREL